MKDPVVIKHNPYEETMQIWKGSHLIFGGPIEYFDSSPVGLKDFLKNFCSIVVLEKDDE